MSHRLAIILSYLVITFAIPQSFVLAQDPNSPDTVRVSTATGTPGGKIVLTVTGFNDEQLAGVLVPLRFPSTSLVCDSVSYVGSRLSAASILPFSIDTANHRLSFGAVYFGAPLSSGDGQFVRIHFSISPSAVAETVDIDTFINPPSILTFSDPNAQEWTPRFKPGKIIIQLENPAPVWQPIGNQSVLEGETLSLNLKAHDPTDPLIFAALNGPPGSKLNQLSDSAAVFTWVPDFVGPYSASGSPFMVTFVVSDGVNFIRQDISIFVINQNALPVLSLPDTVVSPAKVNISFQVSATDQDKEPISITAGGLPSGASFDNQNPGTFNWTPAEDQLGPFKVVFEATDASGGKDKDTVTIIVTVAQNYVLSLPDLEGFSGETIIMPVTLANKDSVGGCQLLLHYDPSALILQSVSRTGTRTANWESFSVVLDPGGNLGDIRLVGIANLPNQTATPPIDTGSGPMVNLTFRISDNPSLPGFSVPVTFKFTDPLDNTLSDEDGNLIDQSAITYKNGSVFIKQLDVLLGDINLNGFAFDIGDAVRFANYFIDPVGNALNAQQIANSDVNQDGIPVSIADLVFLIRQIVEGPSAAGMITAEASPAKETAEIALLRDQNQTRVSANSATGIAGLHFVFRHDENQTLAPQFSTQLSGFETWHSDREGILRVVIFSFKGERLPAGNVELFNLDDGQAKLEELNLSSASGYLMEATQKEQTAGKGSEILLEQNYPNPFNQVTQIAFYLANSDLVRLDIYNIRGQKVRKLVDQNLTAGGHVIRWDGKNDSGENVATGVYLYRLSATAGTLCKKLTFIK